jgi:hypothetical protein
MQKKSPKSSMTVACKPKDEGGLCVVNLRTQNEALVTKNLHKYFNNEDIP